MVVICKVGVTQLRQTCLCYRNKVCSIQFFGLWGGRRCEYSYVCVMRAAEAVLGGRPPLKAPTGIGKSKVVGSKPQRSRVGERPVVVGLSLQQKCARDTPQMSTLGEQEVVGKGLIKEYLGVLKKHWNQEECAVPSTFSDTLLVFWSHPTPILIMLGLISLGSLRSLSGIGGGDFLGEKDC